LHSRQVFPRVVERTGRSASDRCRTLCVLALVAGSLLAAGCSQPASAKRDPVTLRIGVASPKTGAATGGVKGFVSNLLHEPIVGIGWDGRPLQRIASEWTWSSDGLRLDLKLVEKLQFHDGTPLDSAVVKGSLERIFKRGPYVSYQSVIGVEAPQPDVVRIKLSRREALLLADLSNSTIDHPKNPDIGLGPFKLLTREPNVRLAAFDGYYRGHPSADFVEIEEYEDQRSPWAALMRGQLDAVHEITPGAIDFVEAEGQNSVKTFPFIGPYYIQLVFNVRHPILKDAAVRQALSYAVDRQAIIDLGLNRQGVVAEGPIWPYHWAYSTAQKTYTHNAEAATLRLDSAGLRVKPASKPGQMPSRLRFRCLTVAKESRFEKIALVLQKQLYEIGVDMEIEALPVDEILKRLQTGNFDAILTQRASGRSLGWTYMTFHSTKMPTGYSAADQVLERLRTATSDAEVRTTVSDLQQIFHDDPPAIFIAWPKVTRAVSAKFEVPGELGRDVVSTLWQWRPADSPR
jgi:peptide/nickel transport system substrate-binding protein